MASSFTAPELAHSLAATFVLTLAECRCDALGIMLDVDTGVSIRGLTGRVRVLIGRCYALPVCALQVVREN